MLSHVLSLSFSRINFSRTQLFSKRQEKKKKKKKKRRKKDNTKFSFSFVPRLIFNIARVLRFRGRRDSRVRDIGLYGDKEKKDTILYIFPTLSFISLSSLTLALRILSLYVSRALHYVT